MGLSLCAQDPRKAQHGLSAKMSKEVSQDDKGQAEGRPLGSLVVHVYLLGL